MSVYMVSERVLDSIYKASPTCYDFWGSGTSVLPRMFSEHFSLLTKSWYGLSVVDKESLHLYSLSKSWIALDLALSITVP
jgi:hypothetical protein